MIASTPCRFLAISPSYVGPKRTYAPDHSMGGRVTPRAVNGACATAGAAWREKRLSKRTACVTNE
jgi:hypothetical protein